MFSVNQNYFEVFDLLESFEIDTESLTARYRDLQNETHPDKFSGGSEEEKLRAVQLNSYLNEAYATLNSPIRRAGYLLHLRDIDTELVDQSDMDMSLLMEQMQLREKLAELSDDESSLPELDSMKRDAKNKLELQQSKFSAEYGRGDVISAKRTFHALQFLNKLLVEIEQGEEKRLGY